MKNEEKNAGMALAIVILVASLALASIGTASASTIYVPDDHTKIQWAVDNATAGDTIIVRDGIYAENVDVNVNNLTIRSENGSANCTVNASSTSDHVLRVESDNVTINGFAIKDATDDFKAGIYLNGAGNCNISDNNVTNNHYGIYLYSS